MKTIQEWFCNKTGFDSITLYNEMAIQSPSFINKIKKAFEFIKENNIVCVVTGGTAVAHWTIRTLTPDIDFLCSNIGQLKTLLTQKEIHFAPIISTNAGHTESVQVPEWDTDFLDIYLGNPQINKMILETSIAANIGGMSLQVAEPAILTIQKFVTGRNKDINDAFTLLSTINKKHFYDVLKKVRNVIGKEEANNIKSYADVYCKN